MSGIDGYFRDVKLVWSTLGDDISVNKPKGTPFHGKDFCPNFTMEGVVIDGKCEDCGEELPPGIALGLKMGLEMVEK